MQPWGASQTAKKFLYTFINRKKRRHGGKCTKSFPINLIVSFLLFWHFSFVSLNIFWFKQKIISLHVSAPFFALYFLSFSSFVCLFVCLFVFSVLFLFVVFFELSQCMPRHSFQQTQEEYDVWRTGTFIDNKTANKDRIIWHQLQLQPGITSIPPGIYTFSIED
jgi:hypothetical protein